MKNQYYQIFWLDNLLNKNLIELINDTSYNFKITGGYEGDKLVEVEFSKTIKAKNNKEAKRKAIKFADKEGIEIYSLIKFNTEIIATEEDECDYSVSLTATISARNKDHAIEKFLDTPLDRLNTGENIEAEYDDHIKQARKKIKK